MSGEGRPTVGDWARQVRSWRTSTSWAVGERAHSVGWRREMILVVAIWGALGLIRVAPAAEPATRFLESLWERGYYDTALDYLEQMRNSPLAPVTLKQTIEYERGRTLVMASDVERDTARQEQMRNEAQQALDSFLRSSPNHRLAHSARNYLGNLLMARATSKVAEAKKRETTDSLPAARQLYDEAHQVFTDTQQDLSAKLEPINSRAYDPRTQREEIEIREQMRGDFLQAQLLSAMVMEGRADTVEKGSEEYLDLLQKAEAQYRVIEERYRKRMAGLYAKLYRGRCLHHLGKGAEALGLFRELLDEPEDSAAFRELKQAALKQALESWLDPARDGYAEAVDRGGQWLARLTPGQLRLPDALAIQYSLAQANQAFANELKEKNPRDRLAAERLRVARDLAREVAKYPGERQQDARRLLADIQGTSPETTADRPTPTSFTEARTAGKDAMDAMQNAAFLLESLPVRMQQEPDEEVKKDLQQQLRVAETELRDKRDEAIEYYRLALNFANSETPREDLNLVRFFLSHLLFLQQEYFDSGVLSEFIARRYPADATAQEASKIALASYAQLYTQAPVENRTFETDRLQGLAEYMIQQWPDQAIAADAWNALIPFVIQQGEFSRIVTGLDRIPESSPQRGDLELKLGRALWSAYRQGMSALRQAEKEGIATNGASLERKAELEQWKRQAQQILAAGLERVRAKNRPVDESLALASLYLAQVFVDSQQADDAITLLEDPTLGPLELVSSQHPAASPSGYAEEAYKTALRAYLGNRQNADPQDSLEKAKEMMTELKQSVTSDAAGQQRLVAVYMGLARDMKTQMDLVSEEDRRTLSQGFSLFLEELSREAGDFQILNWIAETFYNMAESFVSEDALKLPAEAEILYAKALESYAKILTQAEQDGSFLPSPQLATLLRLRAAMVHRRLGQFKEAMESFKQILTEKNQMLNVQVEAARTFQIGAAAAGFHGLYEKAIMGEYRDPRAKTPSNIVWGWGKIAKLTAGREDFREIFFESRYNLAVCRFEYAKRAQDAATRTKWLDLARQDVLFTYRLYPDLGGADWKPRFENLIKQIQQTRGDRPIGLAEFASEKQAKR